MQFIFDEQLGAFIVEEPTITIDFLKAKGWEYESPMTYYIDLEVKSSCRIIEFHYKDTRQMNINVRYTKFTKRLSNRFKEYTNSNYKYIYSEDDETIFYDLETFDEDLIAIKKMARKLYKMLFEQNEICKDTEEFNEVCKLYDEEKIQKDIREHNIKLLKEYESLEEQEFEVTTKYKIWSLHETLNINQVDCSGKKYTFKVVEYNSKQNILKPYIKDKIKVNYGRILVRRSDSSIIGVHAIKTENDERNVIIAKYKGIGSRSNIQLGEILDVEVYKNISDVPKEYVNTVLRLISICGGGYNSRSKAHGFKQIQQVTRSLQSNKNLDETNYVTKMEYDLFYE